MRWLMADHGLPSRSVCDLSIDRRVLAVPDGPVLLGPAFVHVVSFSIWTWNQPFEILHLALEGKEKATSIFRDKGPFVHWIWQQYPG